MPSKRKTPKWWEQPPKPTRINYADAQEIADVRAILSELSPDHEAVKAWADGNGLQHVQIANLLAADHPDLAKRILEAMDAGRDRLPPMGNLHSRLAKGGPSDPER